MINKKYVIKYILFTLFLGCAFQQAFTMNKVSREKLIDDQVPHMLGFMGQQLLGQDQGLPSDNVYEYLENLSNDTVIEKEKFDQLFSCDEHEEASILMVWFISKLDQHDEYEKITCLSNGEITNGEEKGRYNNSSNRLLAGIMNKGLTSLFDSKAITVSFKNNYNIQAIGFDVELHKDSLSRLLQYLFKKYCTRKTVESMQENINKSLGKHAIIIEIIPKSKTVQEIYKDIIENSEKKLLPKVNTEKSNKPVFSKGRFAIKTLLYAGVVCLQALPHARCVITNSFCDSVEGSVVTFMGDIVPVTLIYICSLFV